MSRGEIVSREDLKKAFGTSDLEKIIVEVCVFRTTPILHGQQISKIDLHRYFRRARYSWGSKSAPRSSRPCFLR